MVGFSHGFPGQGAHSMHRHHPLPHIKGTSYTKGTPYTKGTSTPRGHLHQEGPEADYSPPKTKLGIKHYSKNYKITVTKIKQKGGFYKLLENTWEQVLIGHPKDRIHLCEVLVGRRLPPLGWYRDQSPTLPW